MNDSVLLVKEKIDTLSERFFQNHRLFTLSNAGELSDRVLAAHIYNILYLIQQTIDPEKRNIKLGMFPKFYLTIFVLPFMFK